MSSRIQPPGLFNRLPVEVKLVQMFIRVPPRSCADHCEVLEINSLHKVNGHLVLSSSLHPSPMAPPRPQFRESSAAASARPAAPYSAALSASAGSACTLRARPPSPRRPSPVPPSPKHVLVPPEFVAHHHVLERVHPRAVLLAALTVRVRRVLERGGEDRDALAGEHGRARRARPCTAGGPRG